MITQFDMHLRDERLLQYITENNGKCFTAGKLARVMKCHPNTIRSMTKRLKLAGKIQIDGHKQSVYGYRYTVSEALCNENYS